MVYNHHIQNSYKLQRKIKPKEEKMDKGLKTEI